MLWKYGLVSIGSGFTIYHLPDEESYNMPMEVMTLLSHIAHDQMSLRKVYVRRLS